jgi:twitching motility protein PilT
VVLLDPLIRQAWSAGASDLHLEPGLPPALRVRGQLRVSGEPVSAQGLLAEARALATGELWATFLEQRSLDLSRTIAGVRCRLNIFETQRGVALAVRLLTGFAATIETLNLHPTLGDLVEQSHGLILISGPTGSGKSTTMAGLVQEINRHEARHIITIEQPIEHALKPQRSFIRQREVGRHTPSFEQALLDALREDPDVLVVGEMRRPETIRLTLDAAETGHLVLTTAHSGSTTEALQRVVAAFAPEQQAAVCAQLAECLVAVVCQRLSYRPDLGIRVPVLEILRGNDAVRAIIRGNNLSRLGSAITTGGADGMWSFERYQRWIDGRERFYTPPQRPAAPSAEDEEPAAGGGLPPAATRPAARPAHSAPAQRRQPSDPSSRGTTGTVGSSAEAIGGHGPADGVIDLDGGAEDLASILAELDRR